MAKLYVGNLPFEVTDESLQQMFSSQGFEVQSARVVRDMGTGRSRGFGFVELGPKEDSARAISQLNGTMMEGRALQVNEARRGRRKSRRIRQSQWRRRGRRSGRPRRRWRRPWGSRRRRSRWQ